MELHDLPLEEDQWWGCSQPERPYVLTRNEVWDNRCEKCQMRMRLVLAQYGDFQIYDPSFLGGAAKGLSLAELLNQESDF